MIFAKALGTVERPGRPRPYPRGGAFALTQGQALP